VILCSLYTPNYAPIAAPFLASLKRHVSDADIYVGTCAYDPPLLASLEKPRIMLYLMKEHNDAVLWLDADIIVRRPLMVLEAILENADLTVLHRLDCIARGPLGTMDAGRFNTGVVGVANTDAGQAYLEWWADMIESVRTPHPLLDQEAAYLAWCNVRSSIRFQALPAGYNDSRFLPKSAIWHGKGSAKRHILYRMEAARYAHDLPLGPVIDALQLMRSCAWVRGGYRLWWRIRHATS